MRGVGVMAVEPCPLSPDGPANALNHRFGHGAEFSDRRGIKTADVGVMVGENFDEAGEGQVEVFFHNGAPDPVVPRSGTHGMMTLRVRRFPIVRGPMRSLERRESCGRFESDSVQTGERGRKGPGNAFHLNIAEEVVEFRGGRTR